MPQQAGGGANSSSGGQAGAANSNPNAGAAGQAQGNAGAAPQGGGNSADGGANSSAGAANPAGGAGGMPGSAGAPPSAGSGGVGIDPGDTPPWRPLNVTAGAAMQLTHKDIAGLQSFGIDTHVKQLGKLVIDLGVTTGGYQPWLGKRGFHSMGAALSIQCNVNNWTTDGRDGDGDCRLNTFDGLPHGKFNSVSVADSVAEHVKLGLAAAQQKYPAEDWGYFLNKDGSVRWSDVAFTGMSHGSTTAAVIGKAVRLYRVVSRSGPRDNTCSIGGFAKGDFSRTTPPWVVPCPDAHIASWLDLTPLTPITRFFAFVGMMDTEYGDIMFAMERMHYPGEPVRWDVDGNVLTGTNRFYANAGHLDFLSAAMRPPHTDEAMENAFGVPAANRNPQF